MTPRRLLAVAALLAFAVPSHAAGLEAAVGAVSSAFRHAIEVPANSLVPALAKFKKSSLSQEDQLISLLEDRDQAVRIEAAKSLRHYALNSWRAESALLRVAEETQEDESVRREAIKSLAWACQHHNTRAQIISIAERDTSGPIRAIAWKSLYVVANEYSVRSAMESALSRETPKVRPAAAWALWPAAINDHSARRALLSLAEDGSEPAELRVEAVKSLYSTMTQWEVRNAMERLSRDTHQDIALRVAATLALHAVNQDWSTRNYLESLARDSSSGALRTSAIKALQNGQSLELVRYFHLSYYLGRFIDPLEDQ